MADSASSDGNQYLCFTLAERVYAFRIANVREVSFAGRITPLPAARALVPGVINLRGNVIPVLSLRRQFSLGERESDENTSIVILERRKDESTWLVGVIVDSVIGVHAFPELAITDSTGVGLRTDPDLVRGITSLDDRAVVIVDAERLFERDAFRAPGGTEARGR